MAALAASAASGGVEARVRQTPAGPKLFINGKRHLPRSLLVDTGTVPYFLEEKWKAYDLPFTPHLSSRAAAYFWFEKKNGPGAAKAPDGWVRLRNVRIVDAGGNTLSKGGFADENDFKTGWYVHCPGTTGNVSFEPEGVVKVDLFKDPQPDRRSDFHIGGKSFQVEKGRRYRFMFEACAERRQIFNPRIYQSPSFTPVPIEPDPFDGQVRMARDAGVDIIIPNGTGPTWRKDGTFSFEKLDQRFRRVLNIHPEAYLMARFSVSGPRWLYEKHPEWLMKYASGYKAKMAPPTCRPWLEYAKRSIVALVEHLEKNYPDNYIGLHIAGQCSGEWGYDAWFRDTTSGYDPYTLAAWREFLRKRGEKDADTAEVPTPEERWAAEDGEYLFDPVKEARTIAFNEFQQHAIVDCIAELAAVARKATKGRKLVMSFYGYNFSTAMVGANTGHYGLGRLLERAASDLDVLCGPFVYQGRNHPPDVRAEMSPSETIRRHGVMWWNEDDTRTYRHCKPTPGRIGAYGAGITKDETIEILERNNLQNARYGSGYWWMDLLGKGWFLDEDLWEVMKKTRPEEEKALASDVPYRPDVAVLLSEDSFIRRRPNGGALSEKLVAWGAVAVMQSGVKSAQYHLEDVLKNDVAARCQIHLASWYLSDASRSALKVQRIKRPDLVRAWCWAPGYLSDRGKSLGNVKDVTGFTVRRVKDSRYRAAPLLSPVAGKDDEVWERYEDGSPAVVCRRLPGGGAEVFIGPYSLDADTVRRLAALAAAPVASEERTR